MDSAFDFRAFSPEARTDAQIMALWTKAKDRMIGLKVWQDGMHAMPQAISEAETQGLITPLEATNFRALHTASNRVRHHGRHQ